MGGIVQIRQRYTARGEHDSLGMHPREQAVEAGTAAGQKLGPALI